MDHVVVGLTSAIEALRAELTDALTYGQGQPLHFRLDPIELTLQAVITKEASGKIGWSVLGIGGSYEAASTQTLTLRLTPVWSGSGAQTDFIITDAGRDENRFGPHQ